VFWVISVYFNIRNILPKFGTFLLGHPVYIVVFLDRTWACGGSYLQKRSLSNTGRVTTNKRCNSKASKSSEFRCSSLSLSLSLSFVRRNKILSSHLSHIPNIKLQTERYACTCYELQRKALLEKLSPVVV
jgi:hypothetical protein